MTSPYHHFFPLFEHHPTLAYLDSAATTQTCSAAIQAMNDYYTTYRAPVHRGLYSLATTATDALEHAREVVAHFINSAPEEIVFTAGTTASLNMLAHSHAERLGADDTVVLTEYEHHANLLPWQELSQRYGFAIRYLKLTENFELDVSNLDAMIDASTKVVSVGSVSNVLGTRAPLDALRTRARAVGATFIVDAAQSAAHEPIDVRAWNADFVVFSGHKVYGPTGVGVMYGKKELLNALNPINWGGHMVEEAFLDRPAVYRAAPARFEPGTPPIAEIIGLGAALTWLRNQGISQMHTYEEGLVRYFFESLPDFVRVIGPGYAPNRHGIISFTLNGVHPHDIAEVLGQEHIAVRAGHHCAAPLMKQLGLSGTTRVSFGAYTSKNDIDRLFAALKKTHRLFTA